MTQDEGIDIALRLETAIRGAKAAYELAAQVDGAPVESIRGALATLIGCRLACLQDAPFLKPLLRL